MEIINKVILEQLLYERDSRLLHETNKITMSELALKRERAKGIVSRQYKSIVAVINPPFEVIWGKGGAQTRRIAEYEADGTDYMHITNFN